MYLLANAAGPVPLVLDLLIDHDRFGRRSDLLNEHLHYPNDVDRSMSLSLTRSESADLTIIMTHRGYVENS